MMVHKYSRPRKNSNTTAAARAQAERRRNSSVVSLRLSKPRVDDNDGENETLDIRFASMTISRDGGGGDGERKRSCRNSNTNGDSGGNGRTHGTKSKKLSLQDSLRVRGSARSPGGSPRSHKPSVRVNSGAQRRTDDEVVEYGSRQFYHRRRSYVVLKSRRVSDGSPTTRNRRRRRGSRARYARSPCRSPVPRDRPIGAEHRPNLFTRLKRASAMFLERLLYPHRRHNSSIKRGSCRRSSRTPEFQESDSHLSPEEPKQTTSQLLLAPVSGDKFAQQIQPHPAEAQQKQAQSDLSSAEQQPRPPEQQKGQHNQQLRRSVSAVSGPKRLDTVSGEQSHLLRPRFSLADAIYPQMEHRHKIRPVQLFVPSLNNPNVLRLNKSALNAVLGHASIANRKIVVISVAGAYRKGKSFLLNFFLEYLYILQYAQKNDVDMDWLQDETELEGFRYRPGAKRDTVGIWMWAEPILIEAPNGERYAVILMDTQGCFEQNSSCTSATNNNNDASSDNNNNNSGSANNNLSASAKLNQSSPNINNGHNVNNNSSGYDSSGKGANCANHAALTLSTMLSCVQIYNFAEFIPEEAINALRFFTEYGGLAATEAAQFGKPFQKLVMLVRDFKATEELCYGFEGGATLLERALRQAAAVDGANESDAAANLRQIRQNIRQCFNDGVSCCLLPHPGPKVADQNSTFHGHVKDIKPLFRDEIRRFVESLIGPNLMKPKTINGTPVTEYARMFESPEVPTPRTVLNVNIQLSCIDYALEAKIAYCRGMDRVTRSSRMMAEKKLLEAHIKHGIKALNIYDRCPKIVSGDIRSQNLARLQESINHELERYKRLNEEKRVTTCASAMLACGDSALFGLGLGSAASGAVAASIVTLQLGIVSAGIIAIPVSLSALFGIWIYVTLRPSVRLCLGCERDS